MDDGFHHATGAVDAEGGQSGQPVQVAHDQARIQAVRRQHEEARRRQTYVRPRRPVPRTNPRCSHLLIVFRRCHHVRHGERHRESVRRRDDQLHVRNGRSDGLHCLPEIAVSLITVSQRFGPVHIGNPFPTFRFRFSGGLEEGGINPGLCDKAEPSQPFELMGQRQGDG